MLNIWYGNFEHQRLLSKLQEVNHGLRDINF